MTRDEKLALAGDYVLGLLDEDARAHFLQLAAADLELQAIADRLAARMAALDATAAPAPLSDELWSRIEARLDQPALEPPTNIHAFSTKQRARPPLWLPMAASVLVALGAGYLAGTLTSREPQPTVIAVLLNEADASPAVIIEAFADNSVRLVPLDSFAAPQGQVLEVWTLPDQQTGPVSLGTLRQAADQRLTGPNLPLPNPGQLYEITLEPEGGSPTGRPTGPILVKGFAKPLV